jgi:hypothetical protein
MKQGMISLSDIDHVSSNAAVHNGSKTSPFCFQNQPIGVEPGQYRRDGAVLIRPACSKQPENPRFAQSK